MINFTKIGNSFMKLWFVIIVDLGVIALLVYVSDVFKNFEILKVFIQIFLGIGVFVFNFNAGRVIFEDAPIQELFDFPKLAQVKK